MSAIAPVLFGRLTAKKCECGKWMVPRKDKGYSTPLALIEDWWCNCGSRASRTTMTGFVRFPDEYEHEKLWAETNRAAALAESRGSDPPF